MTPLNIEKQSQALIEQEEPPITEEEMAAEIQRQQEAMLSLVKFREVFIQTEEDVKPASFHEEWSEILLRGTGNFAIERAVEDLEPVQYLLKS